MSESKLFGEGPSSLRTTSATLMKTIMTTAMKKIVTMMSTATKVNDDKAEEALHSMRTQLGLYSPQVFDPLICTIMI